MKKKIWMIDALAFVGFLILFKPQITGYTLHEWLGLAIGIVLLVHLLQHWHWATAIARRIRCVKPKQCLKFGIDATLAIGFITIIFTGLVISSILNLNLLNYGTWRSVHNIASYATLVLLVPKLALHWNLIRNACAKIFHPAQTQQALTPLGISRRKFLKASGFAAAGFLIGVSGLAALLKVTEAASDTATSQPASPTDLPLPAQATSAPRSTQALSPTATANSQPTPTAVVNTGKVLCNKACAFPGRCRLYVDNDQNGLCDRGEPIW